MNKKRGKSVLGGGEEFSWVSPQVDKSTSRHRDKDMKRLVDSPSVKRTTKPSRKQMPRKADEPKQKIGIYLKESTVLALKMQALQKGCSASDIVEELVSKHIRK